MLKVRFLAFSLLITGIALGYFAYPFGGILKFLDVQYRLGLDLAGGAHLVYKLEESDALSQNRIEALEGLRDVIERRVNLFGVSEPVVQIAGSRGNERLIVELAGVFNISEAIRIIGDTPYLEFQQEREGIEQSTATSEALAAAEISFEPTELTGQFLKRSELQFDQFGSPVVALVFDDKGSELFAELTEKNIGKSIAIYLDGTPISIPVVREKITGGRAQITGDFTPQEARTLVRRLNSGALPVPITLITQQSVEASLGAEALRRTFSAAIVGTIAVVVFMVLWYRLPGILAVIALSIYIFIMLALFKLIPVTLSAAAITGFILSVGMAVDANILIFERMKEELKEGKSIRGSVEDGFMRAWTSIRDSNVSSLMTAFILWWFGTSLVKGFALTLGLGVAISMFSAIVVTRTFLKALGVKETSAMRSIMISGLHR